MSPTRYFIKQTRSNVFILYMYVLLFCFVCVCVLFCFVFLFACLFHQRGLFLVVNNGVLVYLLFSLNKLLNYKKKNDKSRRQAAILIKLLMTDLCQEPKFVKIAGDRCHLTFNCQLFLQSTYEVSES